MEVKIISRETVKPCSSTPNHLRTYKLSLLDQFHLNHRLFIPIILFYSSSSIRSENPRTNSLLLKQSLSKTLTHFYPFAGRVKDSFTIDCNDEGVIFIEARVVSDMSIVLQEPEIDLLQQLLPSADADDDLVMLAIQVNYFACGGMAICASVSHVVADASAAASFVESWAAVACGGDARIDGVVYNCASLFPPVDLSNYWKAVSKYLDQLILPEGNLVTKRFLFDGANIAAIKKEIGKLAQPLYHNPSRFEAVSALIWSAMIATTTENYNDQTTSTASVTVNLRKRMNPLLPQQCIGNVAHMKLSEPVIGKKMNLSNLAEKIHDSIKKVDDDYVRELHEGDGYLNMVKSAVEGFKKNKMFGFSSWCKFPFYETDFGWGNPIWFGTAMRFNRATFFLDTRDGEGIEAWITLNLEEMAKFEQDWHPCLCFFQAKHMKILHYP